MNRNQPKDPFKTLMQQLGVTPLDDIDMQCETDEIFTKDTKPESDTNNIPDSSSYIINNEPIPGCSGTYIARSPSSTNSLSSSDSSTLSLITHSPETPRNSPVTVLSDTMRNVSINTCRKLFPEKRKMTDNTSKKAAKKVRFADMENNTPPRAE